MRSPPDASPAGRSRLASSTASDRGGSVDTAGSFQRTSERSLKVFPPVSGLAYRLDFRAR
jgi:hypothetical protein